MMDQIPYIFNIPDDNDFRKYCEDFVWNNNRGCLHVSFS